MRVVDGHFSGYHSATRVAWRRALAYLIAAGAKVIGLTECRLIVEIVGWSQYAPALEGGPNAAECSVIWDDETYEAVAKRWAWLTRKTFKTGTGAERPGVVATVVVLRHRLTGKLLIRIVFHAPASVQRGEKFSDNARRVAAWMDAVLVGLPALVRELQAEFPDAEVVASADTNVNLLQRVWRATINTALAGTGMRVLAPESGTHHDRGIDGHATTMRRQRDPAAKRRRRGRVVRIASKVLNRRAPFDHRGVVAALVSRRRRRRRRGRR